MDVSVVIGSYNQCDRLRRVIEGYQAQEAACSFELIVVDSLSTDGTQEMLAEVSKNSGALKLIDPRPGAQVIMPRRKPGELPPHFWRDVNYAPLDGRIIMFPAWIWHEVETNMSAELRISVSFNFIQKGFE